MLTVRITELTRNELIKFIAGGGYVSPMFQHYPGWDNRDEDGYYLVEMDTGVIRGLLANGAQLDDPQSIEDVLLARIKRTTGMLS